MRKFPSVEQRLWAKVDKDEASGCWVWTGSTSGAGYGTIFHNRRPVRTHRLSYTLLRGEIPDGLELDHLCRNRLCCNPDHLQPVTHRENLRRAEVSRCGELNRAKTHCVNGHEYTPDNIYWHGPDKRWRQCQICKTANTDAFHARRKQAKREGRAPLAERLADVHYFEMASWAHDAIDEALALLKVQSIREPVECIAQPQSLSPKKESDNG